MQLGGQQQRRSTKGSIGCSLLCLNSTNGCGPTPFGLTLSIACAAMFVDIGQFWWAVPLAVARELGLPEDIINVEGGAIAHGHPIGATGAVLTTRLIHSMRRDGLKRGIVTLCIGGGQGIALAIETLA